jgi:hypothetical protein
MIALMALVIFMGFSEVSVLKATDICSDCRRGWNTGQWFENRSHGIWTSISVRNHFTAF